jgi:predicted dehydrogenase
VEIKKIGILGFAHGHVGMYCSQWKQHPDMGIQTVAGWDHNNERASSTCANMEIDAVSSAEDILRRSDIDAVVIASETSMHADLVELAASFGKTIILQKPMALSMEQADRIVKAVNDTNVPFTMAWQMRVDPHNNKAKQLMESGEFGRTYMVRRRHCLPTQQMADFDKTWHVNPIYNRDIFADDASHAIDFIYWLLGMPVSVSAELGTLLNPVIPNDNGIAIYRYADGTFGEASCTFTSVAGENVVEIICENGSIIGNYGDLTSCNIPWPDGGIQLKWYLQKDGKWTVSDIPEIRSHGDRIAGLAGPLAEFIHGVRPPIASVDEGRDVLRMTLACYDSDSQGKRIYF